MKRRHKVNHSWRDMHTGGFKEVANISLLVSRLDVQNENQGEERIKEGKSG